MIYIPKKNSKIIIQNQFLIHNENMIHTCLN